MPMQIYEEQPSYATELALSFTFGNSIQTMDSHLGCTGKGLFKKAYGKVASRSMSRLVTCPGY